MDSRCQYFGRQDYHNHGLLLIAHFSPGLTSTKGKTERKDAMGYRYGRDCPSAATNVRNKTSSDPSPSRTVGLRRDDTTLAGQTQVPKVISS